MTRQGDKDCCNGTCAQVLIAGSGAPVTQHGDGIAGRDDEVRICDDTEGLSLFGGADRYAAPFRGDAEGGEMEGMA